MLSKRNARSRFRGARRQGRCTRASRSSWDALGLKVAKWLVSHESLGCISRSPNLRFYDFALCPRRKTLGFLGRVRWYRLNLFNSKTHSGGSSFVYVNVLHYHSLGLKTRFVHFRPREMISAVSSISLSISLLLCIRDLTTDSKWYDHHPTINAARDNMSALLLFVGLFLFVWLLWPSF